METAAPVTTGLFCGLVLIVALLVWYGFQRARLGNVVASVVLLVYLVMPAGLARMGALDRYNPLPAPALLLLLGLSGLTIALMLSGWGGRLAQGLSIGSVVALQAFRIAVEWLLHRLYLEGAVPIQMTYSGRNFDIVSGLLGLLLGAWLLSGRAAPRWVILGWNVLGLVLLANIVTVAVLSSPTPLRTFTEGPPNLLPSIFPFIWLPSFLVQVALGSHVLIFRQLLHQPSRS